MNKRLLTATAAALALSLGLAACGGGGGETPDGDGDQAGAGATFDAGTKSIVNASDKKGGTLKFANADDFDSTDPGDTYYAYGQDFVRFYSRALLTYASKPGTVEFVPDLAEGMGEESEDGKTWTYKLRKGEKYEDGSEIKAQDIKYAVARTYDRAVLQNGPSYFTQMLDAEGYKGPYKDKNIDNFKGVTTPDDSTVEFHLKEPFPEFDQVVGFSGQTVPVPQDKDKGKNYRLHPLSSGPYKWEGDYKPGKGGSLVRNDQWNQSTDKVRKQLPDKIEVTAGVNQEELDNQLLSGEIHVDLQGKGVADSARSQILQDEEKKKNADNPVAGFHWYVPISTKTIPNVHCRKAIIYGADRDAMWRAYGGDVGGEMATSIQPPSIEGRVESKVYPVEKGYKGDPAKAKAELEACGKPEGFETKMIYRSDRAAEKGVAEALEQSLGKVGIKLSIKGYPSGTYTGEQLGSPAFVKKNKIGMGTYGWQADWPTGYGYLQALTDGKAIVPSGNANPSELDDPAINKLWSSVAKEEDPTKRAEVYNKIDDMALEQGAILPNVYAKLLLYRPTTLTNVYHHQGYGIYDYVVMGVDESKAE